MELTDIPTDLSPTQIRNLLSGRVATLKPNIFNKDSQNVLRLLQSTIEKINKAHKTGKGVRIVLNHGENLFKKGGSIKIKKPKNPFKGTKNPFKGTQDFIKDSFIETKKGAKEKSKVVKRKFDERIVDSGLGKKIASELIDISTQALLPMAGAVVGSTMGPVGAASLGAASQILGDQLNKQAERDGYGLFKSLHKAGAHKIGINKTNVIKRARKVGKQVIEESANIAGDAITAYTGNPIAGETFKMASKKIANAAIDSGSGKKALKNMKGQAKRIGIELVDDYVDQNFDGVERDVIQKAMAGKYPNARDLIYDYGNSKIEDAIQIPNAFMEGYGIRRKTRGAAKSVSELFGGNMCESHYGGKIKAPPMPSNIIQVGSSTAFSNSAQMNPQFFVPSPQLAKPITKNKRGGSMYPAGRYGKHGGSFRPSG